MDFQGLEDEDDEMIAMATTAAGEDEKNSSGEGERLEKGTGPRMSEDVVLIY